MPPPKRVNAPVKLTWMREEDIKHGRTRPVAIHHVRATTSDGDIVSFEHRQAFSRGKPLGPIMRVQPSKKVASHWNEQGERVDGRVPTIAAQLARGVPADVVILSREGLNELIAARWIAPGTDVDLARTPIGVAVTASSSRRFRKVPWESL
mgnify:CR=1 FL=1